MPTGRPLQRAMISRRRSWSLESSAISLNPWMRAWESLVAFPIRSMAAGAVFLGILVLLIAVPMHRRAADNAGLQADAPNSPGACVIDVPIQSQVHLFQRQNDTVLDTIASAVAVAHARLLENQRVLKPL